MDVTVISQFRGCNLLTQVESRCHLTLYYYSCTHPFFLFLFSALPLYIIPFVPSYLIRSSLVCTNLHTQQPSKENIHGLVNELYTEEDVNRAWFDGTYR